VSLNPQDRDDKPPTKTVRAYKSRLEGTTSAKKPMLLLMGNDKTPVAKAMLAPRRASR